jgi:hypothetical protein
MMYRRHGGIFETIQANAHWVQEWFDRIHGEEYIRKLAGAGFNCVTTHFHKGFGMETESGEMEQTRALIEICHRYDIRVFVYTHSISIMPETFFAERPDAEAWLQIDENGRPRAYSEQYWRLFPCLSHDGYVDYVREVTEKAIRWAEADGVWLDNTNFFGCRCEMCRKKFREYLKRRHPSPDPARFGIPTLDHVDVPAGGETYDPVCQEAIHFRCESLVSYVEAIRRYARSLNSEAAVAANYGAPCPYNAAEVLGVDYSRSMRAADIVLAENGNFPRLEGDTMINQILAYKAGHANRVVVIPSHWRITGTDLVTTHLPETAGQIRLSLAESAAFGGRCVGSTWAARPILSGRSTLWEREDIRPHVERYHRFFSEYQSLYLNATSLAAVATYRNFASAAFAQEASDASVLGYEQALIQRRIPFQVRFAENLENGEGMDAIRVLVLANVLCMSDEEIERIGTWVAGGRALVATGQTSLYDENYRQRADYGLADLFGVSVAEASASNGEFRNGRVIFTPRTDERVSFNHLNYQLRPELPKRADTLVGYVTELCEPGAPVTVEVDSESVAVEINSVEDAILIHLVNYANEDSAPNVRVSLAESLAETIEGSTAILLSPDGEVFEKELEIAGKDGGMCAVDIPQLDTYCVVRFSCVAPNNDAKSNTADRSTEPWSRDCSPHEMKKGKKSG